MKLLTKENIKSLAALCTTNLLPSTEIMVQVKIFNPCGSQTWYLTEYDEETNEAYGFVNLGDARVAECGYISITELTEFRNHLGLPLERDMHFTPMNLAELMDKVKSGCHV